ncbi:MAG: PilZ domain-containing protein [Nitrospira sp.]|nr:PilZ domain-containing protein [Nitrospira sp.]
MEPRSNLRVPVDYEASFTSDGVKGTGLLRNLTIGGSEIESDVPLAVGTSLCLRIKTSGARPPIVIALGIVRWKQDNRYGVEFIRFEGAAKRQLEDMLNQRDGSSSD